MKKTEHSNKIRHPLLFFLFGAGSYACLELIARGRTYFSMFLAGGTGFLLIQRVCNGLLGRAGALLRCAAGSAVITGVELVFGLLFNRRHNVWDYSGRRGNFHGQICPLFSLLWALLTLPAMRLAAWMFRGLRRA
ncbi:MAG: hypothetical protein PUC59_01090 [Firmicutes bacterium]|nr:hypothetical protein [Bacillota bacterium]